MGNAMVSRWQAPSLQQQSTPPIKAKQIQAALKRMSVNKAIGLDHWHPRELRVLPEETIEALADIYNSTERLGRWPHQVRNALVAMIPKDGAQLEADMRPMGLLPCIYRVWMCVRKPQAQAWVQRMSGPRILSPVEHTWNMRVQQ